MPANPVLGQIMPFGGAIVPRGWAPCSGQILPISTNQALFSLLGTRYGGNGTTTFALPDLRGRALLGSTGAGGAYPAGMIGGTTTVTLTASQLPRHNHYVEAAITAGSGRGASPAGRIFGTSALPAGAPAKIFVTTGEAEVVLASGTNILNQGGNGPHNNMQPYLVISYLIAMQGTYPFRS